MLEILGHEVGAELAIDHIQHVAVELRGDALGIVIGGLEHGAVLDEIGPEQERVIATQERRDLAQQRPPRLRHEVADRATEQRHQSWRVTARWKLAEVPLEVADHPVDRQRVVVVDELLGGLANDGLGHVERDVAAQGARLLHRVEEDPRLDRRTRSELDELAGAGERDDLVGAFAQDLELGAGRVVLGELGDLLEQLRAAGIVEVLGRQFLERAREPGEDVAAERALLVLGQPGIDPDPFAVEDRPQLRSLAILIPEKIWRRCGKSQLRKDAVITRERVAQEPPRSTR